MVDKISICWALITNQYNPFYPLLFSCVSCLPWLPSNFLTSNSTPLFHIGGVRQFHAGSSIFFLHFSTDFTAFSILIMFWTYLFRFSIIWFFAGQRSNLHFFNLPTFKSLAYECGKKIWMIFKLKCGGVIILKCFGVVSF